MLRNRGVNVTERRIRHDVLRAYECDIFDVPRWRCMQETGCQPHYHRQPRYRTIPKPVYHTVRSSITNYRRGVREYGARRVYLPENEWGTSSAESMVFIRNPRHNTGSYYPNEVIDRPFRRDLRYPDGYYSRRPSSVYMDDDEIDNYQATRYRTAGYSPRKQTQLTRKVTRKLSPILTCDCATSSNVKHPNTINTDNDSPKFQQDYLSKEANNLSLDIFKILSLLRKADGDDDELLSSLSLLQNIHDLECRNSKSLAKLVTQRVQISPKMQTQKNYDPSEKFRAATSVRSKLEALVSALKQYEKEKILGDLAKELFNSEVAHDPKYENVIASDPPSLDLRSSINGKDKKSSATIVDGGKQKDMVLQTEKPKTSNKNVCSMIKTKKDNMIVERKSLRSRLSWKKREGAGIKLSNDGSKERLTYKIGSILEAKQSLPEKESEKQDQATNKAGFMIKIGGNPQRKKSKATKEKNKDKMPTTWIKKFLDNTKVSKNNNIYLRWNNKAFYAKSSSTIIELVNNVYKQFGIKDGKSDEISISDIKKVPKRNVHKSKSRIPRSSNNSKYKQKLKAYMIPQTIVPGPVYMPGNKTNCNKHETEKVVSNTTLDRFDKSKSSSCGLINGMNTTSNQSLDYFEKHVPKDFYDPVSTAKHEGLRISPSDETVYQIIEYETIPTESVETSRIEGYDFNSVRKCDWNKDVYLNMVQVSQSLRFTKRSDIEEINIESRPTKSLLLTRDCPDQDTAPHSFQRRSCSLVDKIMEDEYMNWMPLSSYSMPWTDICKDSDNTVSNIHDPDAPKAEALESVDNEMETINNDGTKIKVNNKLASKNTKKVFRTGSNNAFSSNPALLKETISETLFGIYTRKTDILSVFWSLFWEFLKTPKDKRTPRLDLSLVRPPKTVSEPNCSYKLQNRYKPQQPWSSATVLKTVKVEKPKKTIIVEKQPSPIHSINSVHPLSTEKGKKEAKPQIPRTTSELTKLDGSVHNIIPQKTEELENTFVLDKSSIPIKLTESKSSQVDGDVPLKSKKQSRLFELRRSSLNIQAKHKMKLVTKHSAPILNQDLRQRQILYIDILNAEQKLVHLKFKPPTEPQSQNHNQSTHISCKSDLQVEKLKSDVNREQEEISERSVIRGGVRNSVDILSNEIDSEAVIKEQQSAKTLNRELKTKGNKHKGVRTSVVMLSNKIDPETVIKGQGNAKTWNNTAKQTKHVTYVSRIPTLKNDGSSSKQHHMHLNKTASMKLSLKITKGDKITKISIKRREKNKVNNTKLSNQTNHLETGGNIRRHRIQQSSNTIPNKKVEVFINITNTNPQKVNNENQLTGHLIEDQVPKETAHHDHKATENPPHVQNYTTSHIPGIQHNSVLKSLRSHSLSKLHTYVDNMCKGKKLPVYVMEASPNKIYRDLIPVDETNCIDSYLKTIAAKNDIKHLLNNNVRKTNQHNLKQIVEIERALNAMMMLNASEFSEMEKIYDPASGKNKTRTSRRERMLRRNELEKFISAIKIMNRDTDDFEDNPKFRCDTKSFDELESGDSGSRCNVLTRKLNSYRLVDECKPTNFNFKENANSAANYKIAHSKALEKDVAYQTMKFKLNSSKTKENTSQHERSIVWYCGKKKKQRKKWNTKENIKELTSNRRKNDAIVLTYIDPYTSHKSSFSQYKVNVKNGDSCTIKKDISEINKVDILQCHKVKKAVLQIYSETVTNEGYLVAKIPKYLRL